MGHRWVNYKPFDEMAVVRDYQNFVCLTELSKKYKIGYERIRRCLIKHNVLIGNKHDFYVASNSRRLSFEDDLIKDYSSGLTIIKIARKYHISTIRIHGIIIRNKIPIRKSSEATILAWKNGNKKTIITNRTGTKNLFGSLLCRWKANATSRKYDFLVTKEYLQNVYERQGGLCAYTGVIMLSPVTDKEHVAATGSPYLISLDRINSDFGYIEGNVQFICCWLNKAKGAMPHDKFQNIIEDLRLHFISNSLIKAV